MLSCVCFCFLAWTWHWFWWVWKSLVGLILNLISMAYTLVYLIYGFTQKIINIRKFVLVCTNLVWYVVAFCIESIWWQRKTKRILQVLHDVVFYYSSEYVLVFNRKLLQIFDTAVTSDENYTLKHHTHWKLYVSSGGNLKRSKHINRMLEASN